MKAGKPVKLASFEGGFAVEQRPDGEVKFSITHPWTGLTISAILSEEEARRMTVWLHVHELTQGRLSADEYGQ